MESLFEIVQLSLFFVIFYKTSVLVTMEELLEALIQLALSKKASDIHFVLEKDSLRIQFRTKKGMEKVCQDIWKPSFFEYLKFHAQFDLTNPFLPQSGQFEFQELFCRFSVIMNKEIQTGVLRLLNQVPDLSIEQLTQNEEQVTMLRKICLIRQGLVITCGPTNSGKTTTMHAILHEIAGKRRYKVVSLEDPIEIEDSSYLQLQINEQQGFTYERGIEELLRHDPDVIFIGETRNAYTAHMVIRAALTGHLVFTTLHAKNSLESLQRLFDFGLQPFDLKNTLSLVMSQRLYSDGKGGKQCIYEIATQKEIAYMLEHQGYPQNFTTLSWAIRRAIEYGRIRDPQAQLDLLHF